MKKQVHFKFRKFFWLLCLSFGLSLLSTNVKAVKLSGVYTIDSSLVASASNFKNITSAVAYLTGVGARTDGGVNNIAPFGVNGPVVFTIAPGTYTERVVIDAIDGTSLVNTVTFDGGAGNAATRILTYTATVLDSMHTLQLKGCKYVRFRNLTIQTQGTEFGWAVHLTGVTSNIYIKNCIIDIKGNGRTSTSVDKFNGIVVSGSNTVTTSGTRTDSLEIDSNTFLYGAHGIISTGASLSELSTGSRFIGNTFMNIYYKGIHLRYQDNVTVSGNKITFRPGHESSAGIFLQDLSGSGAEYNRIANNVIRGMSGLGIQLESASNQALVKGLIMNNMIGGKIQVPEVNGIYLTSSHYWMICHNSVLMDMEISAPGSAALKIVSGSGISVMNNIFSCSKDGLVLPAYIDSASALDSMDYNLFYKTNPAGNLLYIGSPITANNFKGISGFNGSSVFGPVFFSNDTILTVEDGCNKGIQLPVAMIDFNNDPRNNPPTIGADEFTAPVSNDLAVVSTEIVADTGLQDLHVVLRNNGSTTINGATVYYQLNSNAPVSIPIGILAGACNTTTITFTGLPIVSGPNRLRVYTSLPGGVADNNRLNDTLSFIVSTKLSGTYSVGGSSAHFPTFRAAAIYLTTYGVSGPVFMNVNSGLYNEQVEFAGVIPGASLTNTITFQSQAAHQDSVVITHNCVTPTDDVNYTQLPNDNNYVLKLINTSYLRFNRISFIAYSDSFRRTTSVLRLKDTASFNTWYECRFNYPKISNANINLTFYYCIVQGEGEFVTGTNNAFIKNIFQDGVRAIEIKGNPNKIEQVIIDSNLFLNNIYDAIALSNVSRVKIHGNEIRVDTSTIFSSNSFSIIGVRLGNDSAEVTGNKIIAGKGKHDYNAIVLSATNAQYHQVNNNSIVISTTNTFSKGITGSANCQYQEIYNNSVNIIAPATTGLSFAAQFTKPQGKVLKIKNNIFSFATGSGNVRAVVRLSVAGSGFESDYNHYFSPLSGFILWTTGPPTIGYYSSMPAWRTASGQDLHSVFMASPFVSETDLHLRNNCSTIKGTPLPGIIKDVEGKIRATPPMVGAYEDVLNNDLKVATLIEPTSFAIGTHNLKMQVQNMGSNSIDSFTVAYKLNGGAEVAQLWTGMLLPCGIDTVTFTGVSLADINDLVIYSRFPNNLPDGNPMNDTLRFTLSAGLSGIYTIGGSTPDFTTLYAAVDTLKKRGAVGPVVFNIRNGVYAEQVNLSAAVIGASASNTITFQSESGIADSVTVHYLASSAHVDTNYIVKLDNASYITIKNLTLTALDNTNATVLRFSGGASFNRILNCKLNSQVVSTDDSNAYVVSGTCSGSNTIFAGNTFTGGSRGLYFSGINPTIQTGNLIIDSNSFLNNYYGIHLRHTFNVSVNRNEIYDFNFCGIIADIDSALLISNNRINTTSINVEFGMMVMPTILTSIDTNLYLGKPRLITNNSIIITNPSLETYGIFGMPFYMEYYHNSVLVNSKHRGSAALKLAATGGYPIGGGGPNGGGMLFVSQGFKCKNNLLICKGGPTAGKAIYTEYNLGIVGECDYNSLYTTGAILVMETSLGGTSAYNNLPAWQVTGFDLHSVSLMPDFMSAANLNLSTTCGLQGIYLPGVSKDIENETRNNPPVMGSYEPQLLTDNIAVRALLLPAVVPFDSTGPEIKVTVQNIGTNPVSSYNIAYKLNGGMEIVQPISGLLNPCGIDTITFTGVIFTGDNDLVVYTSLPNGLNDSDPANDSIKVNLLSPLNGIYTIGGVTPDFTNFTEAAEALNTRGVSGPVTFNIPAGTIFTENPVILNCVPGAALHQVVFQKSGIGANPVIMGINGRGTNWIGTPDAVVTIQGTNNITFDGIDVADSNSNLTDITKMEYGYAVLNANYSVGSSRAIVGSSNTIIKNAKITLDTANSSTIGILQSSDLNYGGFNPVSFSGANHNNRYENIRVEYSYYGIFLSGGKVFPDSNNMITSSGADTTIIGGTTADNIGGNEVVSVYGIRLDNQKNVEVSNCIVRNVTTKGINNICGIYLNNVGVNQGTALIKNNTVYNIRRASKIATSSGIVHGIRIDVPVTTMIGPSAIVSNNVVYGLSIENTAGPSPFLLLRGITHCHSGVGNASYFNNTVQVTSDTTLNISSTAFWIGSGNATMRNNALINTTAGQTGLAKHYSIFSSTTTLFPFYSNNLLWSSGINGYVGFDSIDRTTLSEWKARTGQDSYSLSYLPKLTSDLRPIPADTSSWALNGRAVHLAEVTTDIHGNSRPASAVDGVPDIGAYEFTPTSVPPLCKAIGSLAIDSTQTFLFGGDTVATIKWDIASSTLPSGIEVRQYSGTRPPYTPGAQNYMYAYSDIKASGTTPNYIASIGMYYQDAWLGTNPNEADVKMTQFHNSTWNVPSLASTDISSNILQANNLVAFGLFTGTDQYTPLPVKLLTLTARKADENVDVNWSTASEMNSNLFEVERSFNGKQFEKVTSIQAAGNSAQTLHYKYTDLNPAFDINPTVIYYRLRMVDKDGSGQYTEIVSVKWNDEPITEKVIVFPNPFISELYMNLNLNTFTNLKSTIIDITGKVVKERIVQLDKGSHTVSLETEGLKSGIYFLNIDYNGAIKVHKIIKY